jgi:hypothetical protein
VETMTATKRKNKNAGQGIPALRQLVIKPTLLCAQAELAAYKLNHPQTDTQ